MNPFPSGQSKISVIIPAFNEEENISEIIQKIHLALENENHEILFIDDGSTDHTLDEIKKINGSDPSVQFISFTRNFGHQNALLAGLRYAQGDCVISLDADMQHPPEMIPDMLQKWREGYDIVFTKRRADPSLPLLKRMTSTLFYSLLNRISDIKIEEGAADFRLLNRSVVNTINESRENQLFLRGYISWLGFKQFSLEYFPAVRKKGTTKYTFFKMLRFAVEGITSFSIRPLRLASILGTLISFAAFIYACYAIYIFLFTDRAVQGWTSVLISILFIGGIQLLVIGILGEYLGKVLLQTKSRPPFVIREKSL